ncbi:M23 family metallopeptidase [Streptosporangium sp. KLBMP 9127]|nr:M23 family metallopeptidase [Streptosporangium sp. KLBMP 9127]
MDLAAKADDQVHAAGPGTITFAGPVAGRGIVTISHAGDLRTTYLPVTPSIRRGHRVEAGDVLGTLERGPAHCPVECLHWSLRRGPVYLDPLLLLGQTQIRLLPWWPPLAP